jgi:hypothetical protein
MANRYDIYRRLEPDPTRHSLAEGFAAGVHDPVWFLSRQWQMGEHQGENATTPVLVSYQSLDTKLQPPVDDPLGDPTVVPAEATVEAEADSWWTTGRRVRVGAVLTARHGIDLSALAADYLLAEPPPPYERLAGGLDGLAAWRAPAALGLSAADFAEFGVPDDRPFRWDPAELVYSASFPVADQALDLPRHRGGRVDWFSASSTGSLAAGDRVDARTYPTALHYPGAPNSRWWEIEDAAVDIAGATRPTAATSPPPCSSNWSPPTATTGSCSPSTLRSGTC